MKSTARTSTGLFSRYQNAPWGAVDQNARHVEPLAAVLYGVMTHPDCSAGERDQTTFFTFFQLKSWRKSTEIGRRHVCQFNANDFRIPECSVGSEIKTAKRSHTWPGARYQNAPGGARSKRLQIVLQPDQRYQIAPWGARSKRTHYTDRD